MPDLIRHPENKFLKLPWIPGQARNDETEIFVFLPLIYACPVAASRVFVSSHYPSDVAAGMAIGILGAWVFISHPARSFQLNINRGWKAAPTYSLKGLVQFCGSGFPAAIKMDPATFFV